MWSYDGTFRLNATCDLDVIGTAGTPSRYNPSQISDFTPAMLIGSIQWIISLISLTFGPNQCITKKEFTSVAQSYLSPQVSFAPFALRDCGTSCDLEI